MRMLRGWRLPALVLLLLVLAAAWVGWSAYRVDRELSLAVGDAQRLQDHLRAQPVDDAAVDDALAGLREHARRAADLTSGPTWGLLAHAPAYGDDARGVRLVSDVVADLGDRVEPLVGRLDDLDALVPSDGRVDVDALADLAGPVSQGAEAFAEADRRLAAGDTSGYVGSLATRYDDLAGQVSTLADTLDAADTALRVLPGMLGRDEPRSYLLVVQSNAEVRATGGLPGSVTVLGADDGRLTLGRQVAGSAIPPRDRPVLPLTEAERALYGDVLGQYFVDATMTPDWPRAAQLMRAWWREEHPDDQVDGVLSLDPVALGYVLAGTGPVTVDDVELTADDAADQLLHDVYLDHPDPAAQDAFFKRAAQAVLARVTLGVGDPRALLAALRRGADERRLHVTSFDDAEQQVLLPTAVSGALPDADHPVIGFYLNDATGAKMGYYLRTDVEAQPVSCTAGRQVYDVTATVTSTAPADAGETLPDYVTGGGLFGTEPGALLLRPVLLSPPGGAITEVAVDGRPVEDAEPVRDDAGRAGVPLAVQLDPGQQVPVTWRMMVPGSAPVTVVATRGPEDGPGRVRQACGDGGAEEAGTRSP